MRMDKCAAYLSYDATEPRSDEQMKRMSPWIYGCDRCQEVCPLNCGIWEEREPVPWIDNIAEKLTPEALATMDIESYRENIHPIFNYIPDTPEGVARWHRNAQNALNENSC